MKKADAILKKESTFSVCVKLLFLFGVLYLLVVFDAAWPRALSFFGKTPHVIRTFVILFSLREKGILSLIVSAVSGLFLDLICGKVVPIDSVLYLYISFWCVWIGRGMYIEGFFRCAVVVFAISILGRLLETAFFALLGAFFIPSVSSLFCEGAVNTLCIFWIGPLARFFTKERERENERKG